MTSMCVMAGCIRGSCCHAKSFRGGLQTEVSHTIILYVGSELPDYHMTDLLNPQMR
jgi:hypothetical protein